MINFTRKTEYALLAIEHMVRKESQPGAVTSAREISGTYRIPYPLMTKVMQSLARSGVVRATHGTKGGYTLARPAAAISVAQIVEIFDGPIAVADCLREPESHCPQLNGCHIRSPFYELNQKIYGLLATTTVADLAKEIRPGVVK